MGSKSISCSKGSSKQVTNSTSTDTHSDGVSRSQEMPWATRSAFETHSSKNKKTASGSDGDNETVSTSANSIDSQGRPIRIFSSSYSVTGPNSHVSGSAISDNNNFDAKSSTSTTLQAHKAKLGTIWGVFVPCIQNILGVILFLRLTNITGQAGVVYTSLMIFACVASTFLTALSLSAIATNGTIQAGGPYYVISRTLGIEIGGALGLLFYFGTTLASSMYVLGAIEALQRTIAWQFDARWASLLLMWLVACVVSVGVKYVNYMSLIFLVMVLISIVSMTLGCAMFGSGVYLGIMDPSFHVPMDNIWPNYQPDPVTGVTPTFFSLLAIVYPSFTGILAGSNRSAVLENASTSIPKGTLGAIGFTTTIYLVVVWLFGLTIANQVLINDKFVVAAVAWPREEIVAVGVIFSSIGAALQTCAGAPHVLAAIAMDDALPILSFVKPRCKTDEPTRAVWLTWFFASLATLAGNLDHITPIITMFFLFMYSGINLSCFFLGLLKSPGFRPTFRYFHWSFSLIGFVWCLTLVGLVVHWTVALSVVFLFIFLYLCTKQQKASKNWGDVGNALRYAIATSSLRALAGTQNSDFHAKNWRPQVLTIVDSDDYGNPTNLHVLALASQLKQGGGGIHMVTSIMRRGNGTGMERYETCELCTHSKTLLERHLEYYDLSECFVSTAATNATEISQAIWSAAVHSGLGPMSPNTVLLSYPRTNSPATMRKSANDRQDFIKTVQGITNLKKAVILFRGKDNYPADAAAVSEGDMLSSTSSLHSSAGSIDVWWVVHDGGLLLLLPYILSKHSVFSKTKLRLFAVTTSITENPDRLREAVIEHLARVRITATVQVVDLSNTTIAEDMREMDNISIPTISPTNGNSIDGSNMLQNTNTQHLTVGEVFSNEAYEVPYHAVLDDLEMGDGSGGDKDDSESGDREWNVTPMSSRDQQLPTSSTLSKLSGRGRHSVNIEDRIRTAHSFNQALKHYSLKASLVVTNMPLIRPEKPADDFFAYVDRMCESIPNVLLVRGSGVEVITTYV